MVAEGKIDPEHFYGAINKYAICDQNGPRLGSIEGLYA